MSKFGHKGGANCLCILPVCIRLCYSTILLSRRCDLCTRSVFISAAVVFSLWLQHEPSIGLEDNTGASTGTLTGDNEGVKFFAIYGVPVKTYAFVHVRLV